MQRQRVSTFLTIAMVAAGVAILPGGDRSYAAPSAQQCPAGAAQGGFVSVPDTVSPEWQARFQGLPDPSCQPAWPAPDDLEGWRALQQAREAARMPAADAAVAPPDPDAHGGGAAQSRGGLRRGRSSMGGSGWGWLHRSSGASSSASPTAAPTAAPAAPAAAGSAPSSSATAPGTACAASRRAQSWNVGQTGNAEERQYAS